MRKSASLGNARDTVTEPRRYKSQIPHPPWTEPDPDCLCDVFEWSTPPGRHAVSDRTSGSFVPTSTAFLGWSALRGQLCLRHRCSIKTRARLWRTPGSLRPGDPPDPQLIHFPRREPAALPAWSVLPQEIIMTSDLLHASFLISALAASECLATAIVNSTASGNGRSGFLSGVLQIALHLLTCGMSQYMWSVSASARPSRASSPSPFLGAYSTLRLWSPKCLTSVRSKPWHLRHWQGNPEIAVKPVST